MKLLLAEDEVDMSEALVDILTYHKYTVDAVFDGEEALDYATIGEYDGIILDIMMPKMSGLEVLQKPIPHSSMLLQFPLRIWEAWDMAAVHRAMATDRICRMRTVDRCREEPEHRKMKVKIDIN